MMSDLDIYGRELATDLQELIRGVLPTQRAVTNVGTRSKSSVRPGARKVSAVPLLCQGRRVGSLQFNFELELDSVGRHPAVVSSKVHVLTHATNRPVLRYEYVREANSHPQAHWHVHGQSTELGRLLTGKKRKADALEKIHLPVGGPRFRPSLEDVLQMLVSDVGVDARPGWNRVIEDSRIRWRERQTRVVVRDHPEIAVGELRSMGYMIDESKSTVPHAGRRRLFAY